MKLLNTVGFVVSGVPGHKRRVRTGKGKGGRPTHYKDAKTKANEDLIKMEWLRWIGLPEPAVGPCVMDVVAIYEPPKSWSEAKKMDAICRKLPKVTSPDASNILKQHEDALNGLAYKDDRQIYDSRCRKRYGSENCTEIKIYFYEE